LPTVVRCKPKIGWCGWLSHQSQLIVKELFLQKLLVIHLGPIEKSS
jgi:hypothetical protein